MIELSVISFREYLVLPVRIELTTSPLPRVRLTGLKSAGFHFVFPACLIVIP